MRRRFLWVLLVALVLAGASCGRKGDPDLLARVGSSEIRVARFQERMKQRGGQRAAELDKAALLQEMVDGEVLYVKAIEAGLDRDPEIQRLYRNLLVGQYKERELKPRLERVQVSDAEVQASYDQDKARYTRPAQVRVSILYRKTDPTMPAESVAAIRAKLEAARDQARQQAQDPANRGFGALAIDNSEDQASRYRGGEIGWVEEGRGHSRLTQPVLDAALALRQPGQISDLISDGAGLYLVKLLERRESVLVPLTEVSASIRQRLLSEKRERIEEQFRAELRRTVRVEIFSEALAQVPVLEGGPGRAPSPQPPALP